jgi:hypothetical protein
LPSAFAHTFSKRATHIEPVGPFAEKIGYILPFF